MDESGAKRLSAAIITQAFDDMKEVYGKTLRLHKECFKNRVCDTKKLTDYLVRLRGGNGQARNLPFENQDDITAVNFFKDNNKWGRTMLDMFDIAELPADIKDMVVLLDDTSKRCVKCVGKFKKIATKKARTTGELNTY